MNLRHHGLWLAVLLVAPLAGRADFVWFNTLTNRITYANGGTAFLQGSSNDPSAACFVQLIYAGTNNVRDAATDSGTGVSGDDQVASNLWVGARAEGSNGVANGGTFSAGDVVGYYYVRMWTAPTPNFAAGTVPSSATNYYGDSALYFNSCAEICAPSNFDFGATGFATTVQAQRLDTDGDGLPDWWELQNFGGATNGDAGADGDVDGRSNGQEFTAGTEPTNGASVLEFLAVQSTGSSTGVIVQWSAVAGKSYDLLRGATADGLTTIIATNVAAVVPSMSYTDTTAGAAVQLYGIGVK